MKNLPLGIQTFRKFINGNYVYVDKTQVIYNLIASGGQYFFLSRPRRFGKSVLVSTLTEIFSGNKELFKGLWIYDKIEWPKHPVIHLDFSTIDFETTEKLKESLRLLINETAAANGIKLTKGMSYKQGFVELIKKCSAKNRVVLLIDEYDKPIISYLEVDNLDKAKQMRTVLKNFYGVIKGSDQYLRFVFITGVSKFSRVSIFSDLNNLTDITFHDTFAALLGYTQAELEHYFSPYLEQLTKKRGKSMTGLLESIREWYNGYSWDGETFVYNPFSIVHLMNAGKFKNFWFSTGTPTFLIDILRTQQKDLTEFENIEVSGYTFDSFDIDQLGITSLLFQTGYLTIKKIITKEEEESYILAYPNYEVKSSFLTHLLGAYTQGGGDFDALLPKRLAKVIGAGDIDSFIRELTALFASIPHQIIIGEREAYYHTVIYLVLSLAGAVVRVRCEEATNKGRIDAVLETGKNITIIEFKMGSAAEAMAQIREKKYYEKYLGSGKEITLLGIGFDPEKRNIGNYLVERV